MADGTRINAGTSGDTIATDELTALNGSPITGQKVQRVKVGYGVDGALQDATPANPLPVFDSGSQSGLQALSDDVQDVSSAVSALGSSLFSDINGQLLRDAIVALGTGPLLTNAVGQAMSNKLDPLATEATSATRASEATLATLTNNYAAIIARTATALNGQSASSPAAVGVMGFDTGGNYRRLLTSTAGQLVVIGSGSTADASSGNGLIPNANLAFNGATFDRIRTASAVQGTTGTGLLGVGLLGFDGTNYQRVQIGSTGGLFSELTTSPPTSVTDTIDSNGDIIGPIALAGALSLSVYLKATTGNHAVAFEVSFDSGSTWAATTMAPGTLGNGSSTNALTNPTVGVWYERSIPAGATHFRLRCTAFTAQATYVVSTSSRPNQALSQVQGLQVFSQSGTAGASSDAVTSMSGVMSTLDFNGSSYDRHRGVVNGSVFGSSARTTAQASSDITNYNHSAVQVILDITVASGTGGLTLRVDAKDPVSGKYVAVLTDGAAITATGTYLFEVGLGVAVAGSGARAASGRLLPRLFRVGVAVGDASSYTYSIGYTLIQ